MMIESRASGVKMKTKRRGRRGKGGHCISLFSRESSLPFQVFTAQYNLHSTIYPLQNRERDSHAIEE